MPDGTRASAATSSRAASTRLATARRCAVTVARDCCAQRSARAAGTKATPTPTASQVKTGHRSEPDGPHTPARETHHVASATSAAHATAASAYNDTGRLARRDASSSTTTCPTTSQPSASNTDVVARAGTASSTTTSTAFGSRTGERDTRPPNSDAARSPPPASRSSRAAIDASAASRSRSAVVTARCACDSAAKSASPAATAISATRCTGLIVIATSPGRSLRRSRSPQPARRRRGGGGDP